MPYSFWHTFRISSIRPKPFPKMPTGRQRLRSTTLASYSDSDPPGRFDTLQQMAVEHFWPHSQQVAELSQPGGLHLVERGEGCWVEDIQGNRYFDLISGMQLQNVGYGRKEIAEAVYEQLLKISYAPEHTTSEPAIRLSDRLAALAPDKDSRVFLVSGGSEGIETALKMAKKYHKLRGEPGRYKVISRTGSYHGGTLATISLGGGAGAGDKDFGPLMPGNVHISMPNPYRCLYCSQRGECTLDCGQDVERAILEEGPDMVAAFVAEPLSAATCTIPHPDYWPTVRSICDRYGVLIIADEVVTGFGRTGKMFASDHWGLVPDILVGAKGLSSGYQPIGAAIASKHVADTFIGGDREMFRHIFTFGGHPAACAAALANLDILEREGLVENAATMGSYLFDQLQTLYEHPIVGDVRGGLGLLCGIELVKDRDTRERFPAYAGLGRKVTAAFLRHGLLARQRGDIIFLIPPLDRYA